MKISNDNFFPGRRDPHEKSREFEEPSGTEGFSKFCQQTSLHGWAYLDSEPGFLRRVIWILVLIAVCSASTYFLARNAQDFANAFTVTSIDSTTASLGDIIFPSVYVCNVNQVSKSFLGPLGASDDSEKAAILFGQFIDGIKKNFTKEELTSLNDMTGKLKSFYQWNDSTPFNELSSQNCSEMIVFLEWRSNTTQKFYSSYQSITDYGACCVIVPYLDLINETTISLDPALYTGQMFHDIPTGAKNGIQNGLKLVLDVESYDYAYFPRGAKGFRVALSAATDQAVINQDGFYISTGTEILAALTPSILNTSVKALSRFLPDDRDCYTNAEFKFPNLQWDMGYRYSIKNCLYEAVLQNIIKNCSCLPPFVRHNPKKIPRCVGINQACALKWMDLMGNEPEPDLTKALSTTTNSSLKCRQRCDLQTETMMTTTSDFPNRETFPFRAEYCFVLQKMSKICVNPVAKKTFESKFTQYTCKDILDFNNTKAICNAKNEANTSMVQANNDFTEFLFAYAEDNFAVLYIFIKDPYYTLIKKDESMTVISFIGNAGGLVGLCMGLSFVSIFEVVYHCFNFFAVKIKRCYSWAS